MRLLVYGGNEHNIRCEIGSWDLSDKGALLDTYGIPKDGWVIGFGILKDEGFLFLKTTQIAGTRIYPFTILLDPGEEIWQKFGWNAAHLACSLLDKYQRFRNELVNNPESFNLQKLKEMIHSLHRYDFEPQETGITYLIAGTVFETNIVAINPLYVGLSIPKPTEIAEQIEAMPPFLRTGNGWLFGGSEANAASLGIKLVFDPNLQTIDRAKINRIIQKGNETLQTLKEVEIETLPELEGFSKIPSWRWRKDFQVGQTEVLLRLSFLAEMEKRSSITDDELSVINKDNNELFDERIRQIVLKLACQTTEILTAYRTNFLLEKYSEGVLHAEQLPKDYLHLSTYKWWLVVNKRFPSESGIAVQLRPFDYFEVCQRIISLEANLTKIPDLFQKSIAELRKAGAEDLIDNLAQTVLEKTGEKLFEIWSDYCGFNFFKKYLAPKFEKKAREMVKNKHREWSDIYLLFANDFGGKWLHANNLTQQARGFIKQLIKFLQKISNHRQATVWLQELTVSPLRAELTIEEKSAFANLTQNLSNSWKNFTSLMDLLEGKNHSVKRLDAPQEEIYLRQELKEFLQKNPAVNLEKLREPLKTFFGKYPDEFVQIWNLYRAKIESEKEKPVQEKSDRIKNEEKIIAEEKNKPKKTEEKKRKGDKITSNMGYKCPLCLNELTVQDTLIRYCYQCDRADFVKVTSESLRSNLKCKKSSCPSHGQIEEGVYFVHLECEKPNPFWNGQQLSIPSNTKIDGSEITVPFGDANNSYNSFKHWQIKVFTQTIVSTARAVNGNEPQNVSAISEMWFPAELLKATGEKRMGKKIGQIVALVGTKGAGKTFLALQTLDKEGYLHPTNFNARMEKIEDFIYSHNEESTTIQPIFILLRLRYLMFANIPFPALQPTPRTTLNFYTAFFSPTQKAIKQGEKQENQPELPEQTTGWWKWNNIKNSVKEAFASPSSSKKPFYYTLALCDVAGEDVKQEVKQIDAIKKGVDKIALVIDAMELEGKIEREKMLSEHITGLEKLIRNKKNKPFCIVLTKMDLFAQHLDDKMSFNYNIKQNNQNFYGGNQAVIKDLLGKWRENVLAENSGQPLINLLRLLNEMVLLGEESPIFMVETTNLPTDPNAIVELQPLSRGIDRFVCWCLEIEPSDIIEE